MCITGILPWRILWLLERWPQESRKGCCVLHVFLRRLLHLQRRHVGNRCRVTEPKQTSWQRPRHVGMVLQGWQTERHFCSRHRLCSDLQTSGRESYPISGDLKLNNLQNWSLICAFIEIIVELITISIYAVVFYRFYSKRRLHKSMNVRDKARSDLYLAQLRTQSAPNTPGFQKTPMTATFPANVQDDPINDAENGESTQYASKHQSFAPTKPFTLQPPPIKVHAATPTLPHDGFEPTPQAQEHVPAAPGEQTYDAVPIPGAYSSPLSSPGFQPQTMNFSRPGTAVTSDQRIESPPSSPRLTSRTLH